MMVMLFGFGMLGTGIILGAGAAFVFLYFIQMREEKAKYDFDSQELHQRAALKAALRPGTPPAKKEIDSGR